MDNHTNIAQRDTGEKGGGGTKRQTIGHREHRETKITEKQK